MKNRVVDDEIVLVRYYPNYKTTLTWYQDLDVCKQVDNRDTAYDQEMLRGKNGSEELWDLIEFYDRLLCERYNMISVF